MEGLKDVDGFSHLIVLCHFNRDQKMGALQEQPLTDGNAQHGIFATLGTSTGQKTPSVLHMWSLKRSMAGMLHVTGLDLLDGTPILDIKPYIPASDCIPDANPVPVTRKNMSGVSKSHRHRPAKMPGYRRGMREY